MKRWLVPAAKTLVSLCLIGWFFTLVDPLEVLSVIGRAQIGLLSLALATMLVAFLLSVVKWQRLLKSSGIEARLGELVRYYLIGVYSNNFLPTSIGGDAIRVWLLTRKYERGAAGVASVLAERLSGLLALLLVTGVLSLRGTLFPGQVWMGGALILLVMALVMATKLAGSRHIPDFVPAVLRDRLISLFSSLGQYCSDRGLLLVLAWTSAIYPLLIALIYFWSSRSIGIEVSLSDLAVITSLVTLLTLVPISLNGLGIREGGFVFFLGQIGIARAEALSLSLLVFGLTLLFSVAGGICFIFEKK